MFYFYYQLILKAILLFSLTNFVKSIKNINKTLSFNSNGTFTILQLTDLHYGESEEQNAANMNITEYLIKKINPDLIVITGDTLSGYCHKNENNFYFDNWKQFVTPFINNQKLYAMILGNHDDEADLNRRQIAALDKSNPYSLFNESKDIHGVSNYHLLIHSSQSSQVSAVI